MEFAKPVIGTRVPAPACFAILSYMPIEVSRPPQNTSDTEVSVLASVRLRFRKRYRLVRACPKEHIKPPTRKAFRQLSAVLLSGESHGWQ